MPSSHSKDSSGEDAARGGPPEEHREERYAPSARMYERGIIKKPFSSVMGGPTRPNHDIPQTSPGSLLASKPKDDITRTPTGQLPINLPDNHGTQPPTGYLPAGKPDSDISQAPTGAIPINTSGSDIVRSSTQRLRSHRPADITRTSTHHLQANRLTSNSERTSIDRSQTSTSEDATEPLPPPKFHRLNGKTAGKPSLYKHHVLPIDRASQHTSDTSKPILPPILDAGVPPPRHGQSGKSRSLTPIKPIQLVSPSPNELGELSGDSVSLLDTISMFAVRPHEEVGRQQDIFITNRLEDIALKETLPLPVIKIESEQQTKTDKQRVVTNTAGSAALAGAGDFTFAALRYLTNVIMTHMVSQSVFGIFIEANTVVTVVGYAAKLGMDSVTLRFLSIYRAKSEGRLAIGLVRFAILISLVCGLICAGVFFASAPVLALQVYQKSVYELPFKEVALMVPLIGLQLVISSGLQALKAIKWKVYVDRLIQPIVTLLLLGVFYFLGLRLEALIISTICGFLASTIVGQFLLRKATRKIARGEKPQYDPKTWFRFALPMFFNSMIRNILNSTDVLFLGALATTSSVGLYGAADRVSFFVLMPLLALNVIFSPIIAEYHTRGQHKQLANMFKMVTKWSFSLSLPLFLCCTIFSDAILGIFGPKYSAADLVLIILAFGNLVDSGAGSVNYLLVMTGRPKVILVNTTTTVVVNIALALLLIPRFSILGAALAAALTVVILNVVGLIEVYWILKMQPYRWDTLKPIAAGAVASLVGIAMVHFIHVGVGHIAIFGTLALIIPFMLVYVLVLALLRFSEEDLIVFDTVRSKFNKARSV